MLDSFESLLELIFEIGINNKILLIIDEYIYLQNDMPSIDSILQRVIDKYHRESKLKLVIMGSNVTSMNQLNFYSAPLYGRFTYKITLSDLDYLDASKFYNNYSLEDKVKAYSVFGGNPFYLSWINPNLTIEENIIEKILNNNYLIETPLNVYSNEIKNLPAANTIFTQISSSNHKYIDLINTTVSSSNLPNILNPLIDMGLITKEFPINMPNNKKKIFYYLEDNFLDFYYHYIHLKDFKLLKGQHKTFFNNHIKEDLEKFFIPKKFEKIAKQALILMNFKDKLPSPFFNIGKYWYDDPNKIVNAEFDIVYKDIKDLYYFYEVKYTNKPIDEKVVNHMISQLDKLNEKDYKLGFVSKSGFDLKDKKDYVLIDLNDLYSL